LLNCTHPDFYLGLAYATPIFVQLRPQLFEKVSFYWVAFNYLSLYSFNCLLIVFH